MNGDPRYADINNVNYPACSRHEAEQAARKILIKLGKKTAEWPSQIRDAKTGFTLPRRCWVSPKPTTGTHKGWGRLIHDMSHVIYRFRRPSARPHEFGHEAVEREILLFCQTNNYLDGALKQQPKQKLTRRDKLIIESVSNLDRFKRWEAKRNRADNAMKKIQRRTRAISRELLKLPLA